MRAILFSVAFACVAAFGTLEPEREFGIWKRRPVPNPTAFPFRAVGRLGVGCTATTIGPRHVITAGHCVYNPDEKRWNQDLDFSPGQNGNAKPYGTFRWKRVLSTRGWTAEGKIEWDFAVITYAETVGEHVGWMAFGHRQNFGAGARINILGYPADEAMGTLWHVDCPLESDTTADRLYYRCDTYGGNSGSALYWYDGKDQRIIYGIHHGGDDSINFGARLTAEKYDLIRRWIDENP